MSRYLLDTNIISNITKPTPSNVLIEWISNQRDQDLFIASLTVGEIWRGLLIMPAGRKQDQLKKWFNGPEGPLALFDGRILSLDHRAAIVWAKLMAEGSARGQPRSALDMIIAAIASANKCIVATDNEKDFAGLDYINPLNARSIR
nr:PIN domain-containing protein [uncultured Noviherbaspirillum sp.]